MINVSIKRNNNTIDEKIYDEVRTMLEGTKCTSVDFEVKTCKDGDSCAVTGIYDGAVSKTIPYVTSNPTDAIRGNVSKYVFTTSNTTKTIEDYEYVDDSYLGITKVSNEISKTTMNLYRPVLSKEKDIHDYSNMVLFIYNGSVPVCAYSFNDYEVYGRKSYFILDDETYLNFMRFEFGDTKYSQYDDGKSVYPEDMITLSFADVKRLHKKAEINSNYFFNDNSDKTIDSEKYLYEYFVKNQGKKFDDVDAFYNNSVDDSKFESTSIECLNNEISFKDPNYNIVPVLLLTKRNELKKERMRRKNK